MIEGITPILRADDLAATKLYYLDVLGFTLDWEAPYMIQVSRDRHPIMICDGAQGQSGTWVWIGVEDADALYAELVANGAVIRDAPQNFQWSYEFQVEDPNGHVLRFGSDDEAGCGHSGRSRSELTHAV
ncbi:MAG: bleomycin resistance family protein [Rhodomicrobium sp.]|nr:bleomycin resistance family protein [Rhodomicrobium sp.]